MTYLSNYSPDIVPGGDTSRYCSLLMETTYSRFRPLPATPVVATGMMIGRKIAQP